jgi:stage V sporulation protein G
MLITEVKVVPVQDKKLKAYVTVVIDNCFVVRDLKVVEGTEGLFVSMPSKRQKNGAFKDIAHPINQQTRAKFEETILLAYQNEVGADASIVSIAKAPLSCAS